MCPSIGYIQFDLVDFKSLHLEYIKSSLYVWFICNLLKGKCFVPFP